MGTGRPSFSYLKVKYHVNIIHKTRWTRMLDCSRAYKFLYIRYSYSTHMLARLFTLADDLECLVFLRNSASLLPKKSFLISSVFLNYTTVGFLAVVVIK